MSLCWPVAKPGKRQPCLVSGTLLAAAGAFSPQEGGHNPSARSGGVQLPFPPPPLSPAPSAQPGSLGKGQDCLSPGLKTIELYPRNLDSGGWGPEGKLESFHSISVLCVCSACRPVLVTQWSPEVSQACGESDTHFINDPGARRDIRRATRWGVRGASEEVDFEGLSRARLLTPEMTVVVPASQDSSVGGKRHGPTGAWMEVIRGDARSNKGFWQSQICVFFCCCKPFLWERDAGKWRDLSHESELGPELGPPASR